MRIIISILLFICLLAAHAKAQPIIRDTELEVAIRLIANPIFKAAGLKPEAVQIYIINNSEINAYVSGGNNIFINTGLLSLSKDPSMLIGVLAHETGHITGGHLFKGAQEAQNTMVKSTIGYMLGLAAAAAGSPQAGAAIASGAQHIAQRQILKHTRGQEEAADQSALNFLTKAGISAQGLLDLLEVLYGKEVAMYNDLNPYTLTHPLSRQRVDHVRAYLAKSPLANKAVPQDIVNIFARAINKLDAFLEPTEKTLKKHPANDNSINARYARAIGYYKIPNLDKAISEIDSLIKQFPQDPYFSELKGQILFENGRIAEAIVYYEQSKNLLPSSALFKIQLATAQIALEKDTLLKSAIYNLEQGLRTEKFNSFAWHQLGIAYGRMNRLDMSNLALAEEAAIGGDIEAMKRFIRIARQSATPGSAADLRLKDIENTFIEKN